jgi:hypothetical protein
MWESGNLAMADRAIGDVQSISHGQLPISNPLPIVHCQIRHCQIARLPDYR